MQYRVLLRKRDGSIAEFTPYGVERITGDAIRMNLDKAKALFPSAACMLESPEGPIHMLIGMDHMRDAPQERDRGRRCCAISFGIQHRVSGCGNMSQESSDQIREKPAVKVLSCRSGLFKPPDFIPAEAMGTDLPRRCPACKNCKECQFRMASLTFKENTEYKVILSKLRLDVGRKKWVAGYPFNTMIERLIDNYNQARGYKSKMEARLLKTGRLDEFNRQFQDNVDRGVFKAVSQEEAERYKGLVNYISIIEAFKTGPQQHEAAQAVRG